MLRLCSPRGIHHLQSLLRGCVTLSHARVQDALLHPAAADQCVNQVLLTLEKCLGYQYASAYPQVFEVLSVCFRTLGSDSYPLMVRIFSSAVNLYGAYIQHTSCRCFATDVHIVKSTHHRLSVVQHPVYTYLSFCTQHTAFIMYIK